MFAAAGIDPDGPQLSSTLQRIPVCPLGQSKQLTAMPPAPVVGLDTKTGFTLERTRDPEPAVRCTFSNDLPADVADSIPASRTSSFLEYQVTFVPGAQLKAYLGFLTSQGFDRVAGTTEGGAIYKHCVEPDAATSNRLNSFRDCAAIWLNVVLVVALRFAGPDGNSIDVTSWLSGMIEPIITSLAEADAASVRPATSTTTP